MPTEKPTNTLMLSDHIKFNAQPQPKHRKPPKSRPRLRLPMRIPNWFRGFIRNHGILIISIVFLSVWTSMVKHNTTIDVTKKLTAEFEAELESYQRSCAAQKQAENLLTEDASKKVIIEAAATIMAKSFYGHRNIVTSDNDYYTIGWVEWFRVASGGEFANQTTLEEVISQPNAFMGYTENNPVIETHFNIAKQICTDYFEGRWPTTEKFVYFDWSQGRVIARNDYNTNSRTEYWWYGK